MHPINLVALALLIGWVVNPVRGNNIEKFARHGLREIVKPCDLAIHKSEKLVLIRAPIM